MNIFVLDTDVVRCAQYHVDKHVVKMILETTQLLNNALIANDKGYEPVYRQTHKNHPASLWASQSRENFTWLLSLGYSLCDEYTYRYGKTHKCHSILLGFEKDMRWLKIQPSGMTPFTKCMPDHYKVEDPIQSYRNYYKGDKAYIAKWSKREQPSWW